MCFNRFFYINQNLKARIAYIACGFTFQYTLDFNTLNK